MISRHATIEKRAIAAVMAIRLPAMPRLWSYRKVGGIHFIRVLGFGVSAYRTSKPIR